MRFRFIDAEKAMNVARYGHAVTMAGGSVWAAGGSSASAYFDDAEELSSDGIWRPAGSMPGAARAYHSMTTLEDERRFVVAGGCRADGALAVAGLFDVGERQWKMTGSLLEARCAHRAVRMRDS